MTAVRVRLDVDVTIRVPHEITVEVEEFDEYLADHGHVGPSWATDVTDHHEQLITYLEQDDEYLQTMPPADPWKHEVAYTAIAELEALGTNEPQRSPQTRRPV